jgi:hypothetical protein
MNGNESEINTVKNKSVTWHYKLIILIISDLAIYSIFQLVSEDPYWCLPCQITFFMGLICLVYGIMVLRNKEYYKMYENGLITPSLIEFCAYILIAFGIGVAIFSILYPFLTYGYT